MAPQNMGLYNSIAPICIVPEKLLMQVLPVQTRTTDSIWKAVVSNLFQETCNRRFAGIAFLAKRCEREGCICFRLLMSETLCKNNYMKCLRPTMAAE